MAKIYTFQLLDHVCQQCGITFQGHSNVRYCSLKCRQLVNNKTRRDNFSRISNLEFFLKEKLNLAKHRGKYEVTISYEDIKKLWNEQKGLCALSKIPMTFIKGNGKVPTNISLDRIDSSNPYELGNVQLVCVQVNYMKNDLNKEQFLYWCKEILDAQN